MIDPKDQPTIEALVTANEYYEGDILLDKYVVTKVELYVRYDRDKNTMQGYTAYEMDQIEYGLWDRIKRLCRYRRQ